MADAPVAGATRLFESDDLDRLRAATILSYILYLGVVTMPLGVTLAYLNCEQARDTVYESHLANAIDIFWVAVIVGAAAAPMIWLFGLGAAIEMALFGGLTVRIVKGLGGAVEARPCERRG
jgi:uncharacterized membrane protein